MNFDLISQAREKLGLSVNRLSVLRDLTPNVKGFAEKDFVRLRWLYFNIGKDVVKYGRGKSVPTVDLRRGWRTGNVGHYFLVEDAEGKPLCVNFNGYVACGIDPRSLDERFEGRDIKAYNEGARGGLSMLAIGVAVLTLALGVFVGVVIGPAVSGALVP